MSVPALSPSDLSPLVAEFRAQLQRWRTTPDRGEVPLALAADVLRRVGERPAPGLDPAELEPLLQATAPSTRSAALLQQRYLLGNAERAD